MSPSIFLITILSGLILNECEAIGKIDCIRPNEEYHCGSACQTECSTLGKNCPIMNIRCNDACYCKDGYARKSPGGECIPISECP